MTAVVDPVATACDKGPDGPSVCTDTKAAPADFVFTLPDLPTTVVVRVTALDGITPLPSASAEVVGSSGASPVDVDGIAVFPGIPAGRRTVHAWAAGQEVFQDVALAGGEASVALALPVPVIRATLTDSHGVVVAAGTVEACGTEALRYCNGNPWDPWYYCYWYYVPTCVTAPASSGGVHVFDQLGRWASGFSIDLTGRPTASKASAAASLTVDATSSTVYPVALQLPPTGRVHGAVVASDGSTRVPNANVWISTDGGEPIALAADAEGAFDAPYVLPGAVTVHAADPLDGIPGQVSLDLPADVDQAVQVMLLPRAVLNLHFDDQDWSGGVRVESPEAPRRPGASAWSRDLTPAPNQSMSVTLPAGWYRVFSPSKSPIICDAPAAGADGLVRGATDVSLSLGTHVVQPRALVGTGGAYAGGGSCSTADPFVDTSVAGVESYPGVGEPRPEGATGSDIRAVRTLTATGDGLRVRREQFVPDSGAFGRTTTFISNPGPARPSVTLTSRLALPSGDWTIVTTSDGDAEFGRFDTWVVLFDGAGRAMGLIFGSGVGRSGGLQVQEHCEPENGCWPVYRFEVTETVAAPADATIAFTTFSLVRSGTPEDLALEIETLLDQDATAFDGLAPEERAGVVNFPPPGPPTGVSGTVRTATGDVVPRAVVGILRGGLLVAQRQASETGEFAVKGLAPGPVTVVALDPQTNRPGRVEATVTAGVVAALGDVFLLPDTALGRIDALVEYEGGGAAAGATLDVRVDGFGEIWQTAIGTDDSGRGSVEEVPAGLVRLRWTGAEGTREDAGELAPLGVLSLPLTIPVSVESIWPPVALTVESGSLFLVQGNGSVSASDGSCRPFCGSWASLNAESYLGSSPVSLVRHREVVTPPENKSGLDVSRRAFVPIGGTFARLIDVLTNPGGDDLVVRYQLDASFGASTGTWAVATTSSGDALFTPEDSFAVLHDADTGEAAAIVRGGSSSAGLPDEPVSHQDDPSTFSDSSAWSHLRVPAGSTVRLMQFLVTVPAGPTSVEDATSLARSLADLTHPSALFGLSTAEQATILNFKGAGNP